MCNFCRSFAQPFNRRSNRSFRTLNKCIKRIGRSILFTFKEGNRTRGHDVTLAKEYYRLHINKYLFSRWMVNENKCERIFAHIQQVPFIIVASIPACYAGDRGSIPRRGGFLKVGYTYMTNCCTFDKPMASLYTCFR